MAIQARAFVTQSILLQSARRRREEKNRGCEEIKKEQKENEGKNEPEKRKVEKEKKQKKKSPCSPSALLVLCRRRPIKAIVDFTAASHRHLCPVRSNPICHRRLPVIIKLRRPCLCRDLIRPARAVPCSISLSAAVFSEA
jgi:hypothetical protein